MMERLFGPGLDQPFEADPHLPRSSAKVVDGRVEHLEAHLERLSTSATALGWEVPWLREENPRLSSWVRVHGAGPFALRLLLKPGQLRARLEPMPATPSPYTVVSLAHPLGSPEAEPLAPHKGLTGMWGAEILAAAKRQGAEDGLLQWADGTVVETGIAAVGLERDGEFWLPLTAGRVASLAERIELPAWASSRGLRLRTLAFKAADLTGGQLWCFNMVRGFWKAEPLHRG